MTLKQIAAQRLSVKRELLQRVKLNAIIIQIYNFHDGLINYESRLAVQTLVQWVFQNHRGL